MPPPGSLKNRAPEKDGAGQWNQTEERAQKIIPAVNERVLEPEVEDGEVFVDHLSRFDCAIDAFAELRDRATGKGKGARRWRRSGP